MNLCSILLYLSDILMSTLSMYPTIIQMIGKIQKKKDSLTDSYCVF